MCDCGEACLCLKGTTHFSFWCICKDNLKFARQKKGRFVMFDWCAENRSDWLHKYEILLQLFTQKMWSIYMFLPFYVKTCYTMPQVDQIFICTKYFCFRPTFATNSLLYLEPQNKRLTNVTEKDKKWLSIEREVILFTCHSLMIELFLRAIINMLLTLSIHFVTVKPWNSVNQGQN